MTIRAIAILLLVCLVGLPTLANSAANTEFQRVAMKYIEEYLEAHPVRATRLGVHDHDARLPDMSRQAIRRRALRLGQWLSQITAIDRSDLVGDAYFDHRVLEYAIRAELLEIEDVRGWQRNPMLYVRTVGDAIAQLIDRDFGTLASRTEHIVARLDRLRGLLGSARKNLKGVPPVWIELAHRNAQGAAEFVDVRLPIALREQGFDDLDPALRARFKRSRRRATAQLERFVSWIDGELRTRPPGEFRLGHDVFRRKLLYEEHVDLTADKLQRLNEEAIDEYDRWVAREASRIDSESPVSDVMQRVTEDHPAPEELIATAGDYVAQAQDFVLKRELLTLPTDALPVIRPTPSYARTGFASMSTPGPFETEAVQAYYNITTVDPTWSDERQHQHMTYFNHAGLLGISVHEAMPGHFVQLMFQRELPTAVRKVFAPSSLIEGWAHYTEQMMVDEGLGDGDPAIRLGQLRRALQRHARWHAGVTLHTTDASLEEVTRRFAEIAYFAEFPASRETLRATYDPTYLYYALGRMQILELRQAYREALEKRGDAFSLREFHDRFLKLGLPVALAREAMLPGIIAADD